MHKKKFIHVGAGGFGVYWSEVIFPRIKSFAEPVALVDINEEALRNGAQITGLPESKCYENLETAIRENDADFVTVVVPMETHEQIIDIAINNGLDVVCEKPLGGCMESTVRIFNKVKAANRKVSVIQNHRLEIEKQTMETMIKSGDFGNLRYIVSRLTTRRNANYNRPIDDPIRGLISNGLVHNLDTIRGLSGSNAKTVYAKGWTHPMEGYGAGPGVFVILEMENGVHAQLEECFANAHSMDGWSDEYFRAECDYGTIIADHRQITVKNDLGWPYPSYSEYPLIEQDYWDHALVIHDFVKWLDGGPVPTTCLEDSVQNCALTYATVESAKTGQPVNVQEYLKKYMG